jgi:hypothetical protein
MAREGAEGRERVEVGPVVAGVSVVEGWNVPQGRGTLCAVLAVALARHGAARRVWERERRERERRRRWERCQ